MYDKNTAFSIDQSIAAAAGNVLSDAYDTWQGQTAAAATPPIGGPLLNDIGRNRTRLFCQITTTVTSAGAPTIDFQFVQADNSALSTNLAVVDSTGALALATMVAGYQPAVFIPPGRVTQRWIGMRYVIAVATTTAGTVSAGLEWDRQTNVSLL